MIRAVLTDIEGTTSSLSFVKDVLFPYARERVAGWVDEHPDDPDVVTVRSLEPGRDPADVLIRWIDADRKVTPLKSIQGRIWQEGYREGHLLSHVYPDAVAALRAWHAAGLVLAVYSSGSVLAQQQFFGHTEAGDLRPLFSGMFDTVTGAKGDRVSYERIAAALRLEPREILFLSDVVAELDAARAAGMATCLVAREGEPDAGGHAWVRELTAVRF